jgi:hypothetical protein
VFAGAASGGGMITVRLAEAKGVAESMGQFPETTSLDA